ncbi:MAG: phage protein NinX family protein [Pseudomonadota bacterium]
MRVAHLTDAMLDYWCGRASGIGAADLVIQPVPRTDLLICVYRRATRYDPSTNPVCGWPIIERDHIAFEWDDDVCHAEMEHVAAPGGQQRSFSYGPTSLVAAMRCKVASVYGDTVPDVPA